MARCAVIPLLIATAWCPPLDAQELVPKPPDKPVMLVDIKPKHYIPAGIINILDVQTRQFTSASAPRGTVAQPRPPAGKDLQFLSIVLQSAIQKNIEEIEVEYGIYKKDRAGAVRDVVKGVEKVTLPAHQTLLLLIQGELQSDAARPFFVPHRTNTDVTEPAEEFHGWYVRIRHKDKVLYERCDPEGFKDSDVIRRDFPAKAK
jgi:hypothetical protein